MCTEALQLTSEQLELAVNAGGIGAWRIDFPSGEMTTSDSCKADFGVKPNAIFTYRDLEVLVHPLDRGPWGQAVADAVRHGTRFDFEYRITTPDGEQRWIHATGRVSYDAKGVPQFMSGITQNITVRKNAELARREKLEKAEDILASIADGFVSVDREWKIVYLNERGQEILSALEKDRPKLLGQCIWDLPDVAGTVIEKNYRRAVNEQVPVDFEFFYAPLDSWFFVRAYPSKTGLSIYFLDITGCRRA